MSCTHKHIDLTKSYAVINIREAQGLRAADSNGKSDPFCVVKIGGHKAYTTQTINKTLEPKWLEKLYVGSLKKGNCLPVTKEFLRDLDIQFFLWDSDFASKNEFLGMASLKGSEVVAGVDKWLDLKDDVGRDKATGRIYIRAKFVEK